MTLLGMLNIPDDIIMNINIPDDIIMNVNIPDGFIGYTNQSLIGSKCYNWTLPH